jgi:copper chaperone
MRGDHQESIMKFDVPGITCGHCRTAITDSIHGIDPTAEVVVTLSDKTVAIKGQLTTEQARLAIMHAGYEAVQVVDTPAPAEVAEAANCCGHCHV